MNLQDILNKEASSFYFIGIGGVSMSSLAKLLKNDGHKVSGSDIKQSENVQKLTECGINVNIGQKSENILYSDAVIYTAAVKEDNPEMIRAKELGLNIFERCELLGAIMKKYKYPINIAGTHGKTTTTSMLSEIFIDCDKNPTVSIGGNFGKIDGNLKIGAKDYFVCEACEYVESFLKFYPFTSIILNIEEDHLDYFSGIEHIKSAFLKFANLTDKNGFVILNGNDKNCLSIRNEIKVPTYTFGLTENCDCYAKNIEFKEGHPSFDVYRNNLFLGHIDLSVYGKHNILNALASILCADLFGLDFNVVKKSLFEFAGAKRRFEFKGEYNNALIYDDYAHHPTEIRTAIESAKSKNSDRLFIVFQPHTYTRTKKLFDEFVEVLSDVPNLILADIYAAREKNTIGISSKDIADKIPGSLYIPSLSEIEKYLKSELKKGDMLLTVGAGDVYTIGESILK